VNSNEQLTRRRQCMSEVRLEAARILVRGMFRYGQIGRTQVQELRREGNNRSLPERALAQAEPI
jgi:hypothetical protein